MKYSSEIVIKKPIKEVVGQFDSAENLSKWMKGLQSFEHISGTPGEVGAKSKMVFKMGNREIEMIETILVKNLPDEFTGTYEAKGVTNWIQNKFVPVDDDTTKYITVNEFQFKGFMKVLAVMMPKAFKKQSLQYMLDFKSFVENPN